MPTLEPQSTAEEGHTDTVFMRGTEANLNMVPITGLLLTN